MERHSPLHDTATRGTVLFHRPGCSDERIYERTTQFPNVSVKGLLTALDFVFPSYLEAMVPHEDIQNGSEGVAWWLNAHTHTPL
jgi:hypothetical protein